MSTIIENKSYSNITYPSPAVAATENIVETFIAKKCTQCKTSHTLKIDVFDVFELLDKKIIGKLLSKNETFSIY